MARFRFIILLAILGAAAPSTRAQDAPANDEPAAESSAEAGKLTATASASHLWIVNQCDDVRRAAEKKQADSGGGDWDLLHHAAEMGGPYVRSLQRLAQRPAHLAAWEDRLWLAYLPRPDRPRGEIEIFTVRVRLNPMGGAGAIYFSEPHDRLESLTPLPGDPKKMELLDFAGSPNGPIALIRSDPSNKGEEGFNDDGIESSGQGVQLLRLTSEGWDAIELPSPGSISPTALIRLGVSGEYGSTINLLTATDSVVTEDGGSIETVQLFQRIDDAWRQFDLDLPQGFRLDDSEFDLITIGVDLAAVSSSADSDQITLVYVLPAGMIPIGAFDRPSEATTDWTVCGMGHFAQLLERAKDGTLTITQISCPAGEVGAAVTMTKPPADVMTLLRLPVLLAITLFAIGLAVFLRPRTKTQTTMPTGFTLLALAPRMIALLIDLFPAGILSLLLFDVRPALLLRLPLITSAISDSLPFIVMITLTIIHITLTELAGKPSLGKALMDGRVISFDGSPPSARDILLRNAMKFVTMLIPPLGILAFMNPNLQALHDLIARTLVVRPPNTPDDPNVPDDSDAQSPQS